ncbi:hypothetical protein WMY93_011750 [Mugilogobius chulae]|uniref:Glucose-6-phosphate dehydrogenase n=1 Tax=Mugilogobius chulae TaxID=88201 RepID=A0AAW0PDJ3_9GOBI
MLPFLLGLFLLSLCSTAAQDEAHKRGHVSVVVLGGTGDLARKYLWQGFFELYANKISSGHSFSFYGGGLSPANKSTPVLYEILKALNCSKDVPKERIQKQLKQEGLVEAGRLFYLSVPAFAYAEIADRINSSCRPPKGAWLRVVLEKPFGHDFRSAQELATKLGTSLKDEEMYRIDHYLGKQVVSNILQFRMQNKKHLDSMWNKYFIERVEIVLKETLDVKGRIAFYDQYGVIRDVLQNHLTEVMTLLTMRLPLNLNNSQEVLTNKLNIFTSLLPLSKNQAVIGQYQTYQKEVQQELNKTKDHVSLTPTFAAVLAHIDETQYEDVPILMISGKQLDERVGYARILFKDNVFCLQNKNSVHCKPKQIIFYFGHGSLKYPAILVSKIFSNRLLLTASGKK